MILAITGATGFVGSHLVDQALAAGHQVRALIRREQPARDGVTWVAGNLAGPGTLVEGADAVIHVAGIVNAADRAGFVSGNIDGTRSMISAAGAAGVQRFVHVSSLAAREPHLSDYGWSKSQSERLVQLSGLDWTIVRPPAVFGPRDHEMLELFRFASRGIVPLPPRGNRLSVIAAEDLARLLLTLATGDGARHMMLEPDDGRPGGWDHRDFARALAKAVGRRALPLSLPGAVLSAAARLDRMFRGPRAKLTPDRVGYFRHPDWIAHALPSPALWRAEHDTAAALARTAEWYRAHDLL